MTKIIQWVITMASEAPKSTVSLVGQGSILNKTPLHLAGYLGKNPESSAAPPDGWCPVCKAKGQSQALRAYRINFTQSIFLCSNRQCIYPLGYTPLDNIIANTDDLKKQCHLSKQKKHILKTSPPSIICAKKRRIDGLDGGSSTPQSTLSCPVIPNCNSSPIRTTQECVATIQSQTFQSSSNNVSMPTEQNVTESSTPFYSSNGKTLLVHDVSVPPATQSALQWEPPSSPKDLYSDFQCEIEGPDNRLDDDIDIPSYEGTFEKTEGKNSILDSMLNGTEHEESMEINSENVSAGINIECSVAENGPTETNSMADTTGCDPASLQSPKPKDIAPDHCLKESLSTVCSGHSHSEALYFETINSTCSSLPDSELVNDANLSTHRVGEASDSPKAVFQDSEPIKDSPGDSAKALFSPLIDAEVYFSKNINVSDTSLTESKLSEPTCIAKDEQSPPTSTDCSSVMPQSGLDHGLQESSSVQVLNDSHVVKQTEDCNVTILTEPDLPQTPRLVQDCSNKAELTKSCTVSPEHQVEEQSSAEVCSPVLCKVSFLETSGSINLTSSPREVSQSSPTRPDEVATESPPTSSDQRQNPIDVQETASSLPAPILEQECGGTSGILTAENPNPVPDVPLPDTHLAAEKSNGKTQNKTCKYLQWRNKYSLCWLNCIMSSLVHMGTLKNYVAEVGPTKESVIHTLFEKYKEASAILTRGQKNRRGHLRKLSLAHKCLEEVRMVLFDNIKTLLKCNLGDKESPVFAFPLLLRQDPVFEELFLHSCSWSFSCNLCGHESRERYQKTITTFTKIVPDWNPLNAVHTAPCNKCQDTGQKRKMNIEKIHSIFMLHFVEGLPSNDLQLYSFEFEENVYEVKGVIQYYGDHFSAWVASEDGTWMESDDLKGYYCRQHKYFGVAPNQIHIVIWERSALKVSEKQECPPVKGNNSVMPLDPPASTGRIQSPPSSEVTGEITSVTTAESLTPKKSGFVFGFEGYADDDVITLTLTEVLVDSFGNRIENVAPIENYHDPVDTLGNPTENGVAMVEKGFGPDVSLGGPDVSLGGPDVSLGGPDVSLGGPDVSLGGPDVSLGGPDVSLGGPDVSLGGPDVSLGGPDVSLGGPDVSLGGPDVSLGNPDVSRDVSLGNPDVSRDVSLGNPDVSLGNPDVSLGNPDVSLGNPDVSLGNPDVSLGNPDVSLGNPDVSLGNPDVSLGNPVEIENYLPPAANTQSERPTTIHSALPSASLPQSVGCGVPNICTLLPLDEDRRQASGASISKTVNALYAVGGEQLNPSASSKSEYIVDAPLSHATPVKTRKLSIERDMPFSPPDNKTWAKHSNTSASPSPEGAKRGVVGSWMKSLLSKNPSAASTLYSAPKKTTGNSPSCSRLKISDSNPVRQARSFDGFRTKGVLQKKRAEDSPLSTRNANELSSSSHTANGQASPSVQTFHTPAVPNRLPRGRNGTSNSRLSTTDHSLLSEDKIRRLRLKLLKKLKAKKSELATLETLARTRSNNCTGNQIDALPEAGTFNRREHLRGFLQELQDHIDNADNESVCTMSSNNSICSSPGDADFLAELLSPSNTTVATTENTDDGTLLEMWMDGLNTSLSSDQTPPQSAGHPQLMSGNHFPVCEPPSQKPLEGSDNVTNYSFESSMHENFNALDFYI